MNTSITEKKSRTRLPDIMRAAIHLFVKKGIDGTTIADIATEAKVAEGALYRHFKSKDDLAWHLFSANLNQFTADLMAKVYPETTAEKRIHKFVVESFVAYEQNPELYSYLIVQEHSELDKYAKSYMHPGNVVMKIIEDGQKSGEIRKGDLYVLGSMLIGAIIRICVVKMYGSIHKDLRNYSNDVSNMAWSMLKAKREKE